MSDQTTLAVVPAATVSEARPSLTREQVELVKRTVAAGATDDELRLFLHTCARTGLDPLARQIHAIKRWNSRDGRETMTIQTGIDGYRLIAERTGRYAPGAEPRFVEEGEKLVSATAFVKKLVAGTWHEVAATAFFDEYKQVGKSGLSPMWARMPRLMLSKCAEALALRRAFPAEMSGVYTTDEMGQAPADEATAAPAAPAAGREPGDDDQPVASATACPHCGSVNVGTARDGRAFCRSCRKGV